jgi:hypothetical protein
VTTFYEIINAPLTLFLSPKEAKRGAYDLEINSDPISSETPEMTLTKKEEVQAKKVARELLETLKREKLVLDWRKTQATRAAVRVTVEDKLDELSVVFIGKSTPGNATLSINIFLRATTERAEACMRRHKSPVDGTQKY